MFGLNSRIRYTEEQTLLLQAALLPNRDAVSAFERWYESVDIDAIDLAEQRLLPLLYQNLKRLDVVHARMDLFKGVHRYWWYRNSRRLAHAANVLRSLEAAGIEDTLLLKGAALVSGYYENRSLRPMNDVDVLVHPAQLEAAIETLAELGFALKDGYSSAERPSMDVLLAKRHAVNLEDGEGRPLDLHWSVYPTELVTGVDDADLWEAATLIELHGVPTKALCPADQLMHVCVHGVFWTTGPALWWAGDAATILQTKPTLDWDRLVHQAIERRMAPAVAAALDWLQETLDVAVDGSALRELKRASSRRDRVRFWETSGPMRRGGVRHGLSLWRKYRRYASSRGPKKRGIWGLPLFLRERWNLESSLAIPASAAGRLWAAWKERSQNERSQAGRPS